VNDNLGVVCIFTSTRTSNIPDVYDEWSEKLAALVTLMPGYLSHSSWRDPSGKGVTIAYFTDEHSMSNWGSHPVHREAQHLGQVEFYDDYTVEIATITSRRQWSRP